MEKNKLSKKDKEEILYMVKEEVNKSTEELKKSIRLLESRGKVLLTAKKEDILGCGKVYEKIGLGWFICKEDNLCEKCQSKKDNQSSQSGSKTIDNGLHRVRLDKIGSSGSDTKTPKENINNLIVRKRGATPLKNETSCGDNSPQKKISGDDFKTEMKYEDTSICDNCKYFLKSFDNIKDICQFEAIENNGCPETIPFNRTCKDFVSKYNSLGKKDNSDSSNESYLDTQNITREENKSEHMLVGVDNHPDDNWTLDKQMISGQMTRKKYIYVEDVKLFLNKLEEKIINDILSHPKGWSI